MKSNTFDVGIIGGSVGGAATALSLIDRGFSVALFDRNQFPRNKICGEGLSTLGLEELDRLSVKDEVLSLPHRIFHGFRFFEGEKQSELSLAPTVHGIGMRRLLLDALLLETCKARGVFVSLGSIPIVTQQGAHAFSISTPECTREAKYLVYATGASFDPPNGLGIEIVKRERSRCGMSAYLTSRSGQAHSMVDIFISPSIQACLTPVDENTSTLSVLGSHDCARHFHPSKNREILGAICSVLRFTPQDIQEVYTTSNIGRTIRRSQNPRVFLVGDSLQQLDPIGGMGMTQALTTGRLTADTLNQLLHAPSCHQSQIIEAYNRESRKILRLLTAYTRLTYWSLSTNVGRATVGKQKTGRLAKEVLLSMHRQSTSQKPYGIVSKALLKFVSVW